MIKVVGKIDLSELDRIKKREEEVIKKRAEAKKAESNKRAEVKKEESNKRSLAAKKAILEMKKKKEDKVKGLSRLVKLNESRLKKAKTQLERNAIKNNIGSIKDKLQKLK